MQQELHTDEPPAERQLLCHLKRAQAAAGWPAIQSRLAPLALATPVPCCPVCRTADGWHQLGRAATAMPESLQEHSMQLKSVTDSRRAGDQREIRLHRGLHSKSGQYHASPMISRVDERVDERFSPT